MLLPNPFAPITAAQITALKATVLLLLALLIKSNLLRVKMSLLGSLLGLLLLSAFLASTGLLTLVTGGALVMAARRPWL